MNPNQVQSFLLISSIPIHLLNILSVLLTRNLRKQKAYVIFLNLSFSDLFAAIFAALRNLYFASMSIAGPALVFVFMSRCFYFGSVLFTCCITLDRYIKVRYCLRYHGIATQKKIIQLIVASWTCSFIFVCVSMLPYWLGADTNRIFGGIVIHVIVILCSVCLIVSALWVKHIRNSHLREIQRRKIYLGTHGEELSVLKSTGASIVEVVRLNMLTAVLLSVISISGIVVTHFRPAHTVSQIAISVYNVSNLFVYLVVMNDLKEHYMDLIRRFRWQMRPNQIHPIQWHRDGSVKTIK